MVDFFSPKIISMLVLAEEQERRVCSQQLSHADVDKADTMTHFCYAASSCPQWVSSFLSGHISLPYFKGFLWCRLFACSRSLTYGGFPPTPSLSTDNHVGSRGRKLLVYFHTSLHSLCCCLISGFCAPIL